jgi:hypothetical protein
MKTALAPSASALNASVPRHTPPSRYTSQRPFTALTISGSISMVDAETRGQHSLSRVSPLRG